MLYIYNPTAIASQFTLLGKLRVTLRTFTLGLVLAEGPPGVALLAHVSVMLGATAAGLGLAVQTLACVC